MLPLVKVDDNDNVSDDRGLMTHNAQQIEKATTISKATSTIVLNALLRRQTAPT